MTEVGRDIPTIPLDSDNRFPFKSGVGSGSDYEVVCGLCGTVHNKGLESDGGVRGESVSYVYFANKTVAECCFGKLEDAILAWAPEIVAWLDWRARKHEQLAETNREMAQRGVEALGLNDLTEVPADWECYSWDRDHRMRCGSMHCPLKGKCTAVSPEKGR